MNTSRRILSLTALALVMSSVAACRQGDAPAQARASPASGVTQAPRQEQGAQEGYQPEVGQAGKDVVWVPTPQPVVDRMLDMAKLTPEDRLVDLGSGDGVTVITAARRGAMARGIEYNQDLVALAMQRARDAGVSDRARFQQADIFKTDFSDATVVTLFLLPELNRRLRPTLLDMKPGTRVVSNSFDMGEWQADEIDEVKQDCSSYCTAMLWVVPAKVGGRWLLDDGRELQLSQTFQMLEGTLGRGDAARSISGRMRGSEISFRIGDDEYTGTVDGERISGTVNGSTPWRATRQSG